MSAFTLSLAQPVRAAASAAVAATVPAPSAVPQVAPDVRYSQVSPESALNVTTETVAAIQQLGDTKVRDEDQPPAESRSFQDYQAEARRWEQYYSRDPRRLEDLLAVYYGGLPGSRNASLDPRGPHHKALVEYVAPAKEAPDDKERAETVL